MNVFVVDDDTDFLEILTTILEEAGFHVTPKSTPLDALREFSHTIPDAIVVDYDMPVMDGLEFTQAVRKNAALVNVPIIIMSAHRHASQLAADSGANLFLPKPFDTHKLVRSLITLTRSAKKKH